MVEAWFMDGETSDQRLQHHCNPPEYINMDELFKKTGVEYFQINADDYENDNVLQELRKKRNYSYEDEITCSEKCLPDYANKLISFFIEHLHTDEEIRLVLDGSGYFDVRDAQEKWIRVAVTKGDLIIIPAGIYHRFTLDVNKRTLIFRKFAIMTLIVETIPTTIFDDQKPGTSGLRKKVKVFTQVNYTENFIQCVLAANGSSLKGSTLIVGGDGRYYCKEAIAIIIRICAANGVCKLLVGQNGILSTPAVSGLIRHHKALGGIVLTASHNPGGPDNDFGIKFNCENGGPAPDTVTNHIYQLTNAIKDYKIVKDLQVDITKVGIHTYTIDNQQEFVVEIIDSVENYVKCMKEIFDFVKLRKFLSGETTGKPLRILIDSMNGVTGPYVREIFLNCLSALEDGVVHTRPLPDFGGLHPDPNLTYAKDLVQTVANGEYDIGAAFDGDGDRNMIVGYKAFFVTPSDSLAVIAHHLGCIPYFQKHGIQGFARSMPTAAAIDLVGQKLGREVFEVPTGWKYFGNLMDAGYLCLCGEESFGTGSNHIREKDGIWAVLAWLSIMQDTGLSVEDILKQHWSTYGRNYFTRYDYEECELQSCNDMMAYLEKTICDLSFVGREFTAEGKSYKVKMADNFSYTDPIDKSVAIKQGIRVLFEDGSRIIIRLSGTGSTGGTVRLYIDSYEKDNILGQASIMLKPLINVALEISRLPQFTGRSAPTVIT
ncbi:hypothetical protein GQX74_002658 [Glossina fuscipes]|nr:hypothetical protein GQX74_002658 [Glossina fuscipes]